MLSMQRGTTTSALGGGSSSSRRHNCAAAARAGSAVPISRASRTSSSSSSSLATPAGLHHQQQLQHQQQQRPAVLLRALKDEQAEIDRIAREADAGSDVWSNEVVSTLVKVFLGGAFVGVIVLLATLVRPMYDNTIKSFPTPASYEQYEKREAAQGY